MVTIKPPVIRRKYALIKTVKKSEDQKRSLLYQISLRTPENRLKSRNLSDGNTKNLISSRYDSAEEWRKTWASFITPNEKLVS